LNGISLNISLVKPSNDEAEINLMLEKLQASGYRFTRPLAQRAFYIETPPSTKSIKAVILDTETTGTNFLEDKIIELGMVAFDYCPDSGNIGQVLGTFNQLDDPGIAIPPESTKIHHITDEMVSGKKINENEVEAFLDDVALIIAHNANFDRRFVETRFPIFSTKAWACSWAQIPWGDEGLGSGKLEFLAYKSGFHYEGHRASIDCLALLEVLHSAAFESGRKPLQLLLQRARANEIKVTALKSPFDTKEQLKARRYQWNSEMKSWAITVLQAELLNEIEWLKKNIYNNNSFSIKTEKINAYNRFSTRLGEIELMAC